VISPAGEDNGGRAEDDRAEMEPKTFRVVLRGRLSERFASAFDGVALEPGAGKTTLVGSLDQAQLWGILESARAFGFELVRVEEVLE
jgi:hypothetical protein